jgi:hypothetical protein
MDLPRLVKESNLWINLILSADRMIDQEQAAAFDMGARPLEWLFSVLAGLGVAGNPRLKGRLRRLLEIVSNAGVIQSFYIRSQNAIASRMTRQLGLSTLLDARQCPQP